VCSSDDPLCMINSNQSQSYTPSTTTSSSMLLRQAKRRLQHFRHYFWQCDFLQSINFRNFRLSDLRSVLRPARTRMTALETSCSLSLTNLKPDCPIKPLEAENQGSGSATCRRHGNNGTGDRRNSLYNEYEPLFKRRRALFEANSSDFKSW